MRNVAFLRRPLLFFSIPYNAQTLPNSKKIGTEIDEKQTGIALKRLFEGGRGGVMKNRILVMEEDWVVLQLMKSKLEALGYEVNTARNESEFWAQSAIPGLGSIILDICMKKRLGTEVYRSLLDLGLTKKVPVILTTGLTDEHQLVEVLQDENCVFFSKPISFEQLQWEIEYLFKESQLHAA